MISVVIVDDQELVRAGLRSLLEPESDFTVLGEAADGDQAITFVDETAPDVVLMDIRMPVLDGIAATRAIKELERPPAVLILTTFDTDDHVYEALEAGADGFLVKDTPPVRLLDSVRAAANGGVVIGPQTAARLRDQMLAALAPTSVPGRSDLNRLTPRELEVLGLIGRGLTNTEIADELFISELTAKTHVSRILTKLDLDGRVHAVILAYDTGLVTPR